MTVEAVEKKQCYGCGLCKNVCPTEAVALQTDQEGFWYPRIDWEKCLQCGLCLKKCPVSQIRSMEQVINPEVYACYSKHPEVQVNSTSGGVFSELAANFLKKGGIVIGAQYTEDFLVEHACIFAEKDIPILRQSKYLQSDTGLIYREAEDYLKNGCPVLFCGTPCQNAALRSFLGRNYQNLTQCDFICRGVASPKVFRKYLDMLEKRYDSKAVKVQFKNKRKGWHCFGTKVTFQNGKSYYKDHHHDPYMIGYLEYNLFLRPSCHSCGVKGVPQGDLTLGDFWGIENICPEMDPDRGTSVVILNTIKGKKTFEEAKKDLYWKQRPLDDVNRGNICLKNSVLQGENRQNFFRDIDRMTFDELMKRYASLQGIKKLKRALLPLTLWAKQVGHSLFHRRIYR